MKTYLVSLAAGLLVGGIYGGIGVRSPAPPVVALLGLLGMLLGEQAVTVGRRLAARKPVTMSWVVSTCAPPVLGTPQASAAPAPASDATASSRRS